jgi:hypothetical protein
MKLLLSIGVILFLCTGCMKYQYLTVDGPAKNDYSHEIAVENDSVSISYKFSGGLVSVQIYNKLEIPLFVDWQQSSLILQGHSISESSQASQINADISSANWKSNNGLSLGSASLDGTISQTPQYSFIPPKAFVVSFPIKVIDGYVNLNSAASQRSHYGEVTFKFQTFTAETSPLSFRTYLTISTEKDFKNSTHFDHFFWVSRIVNARVKQDEFPGAWGRKDYLLLSKATGTGVLLGTAALAGCAILSAQAPTR